MALQKHWNAFVTLQESPLNNDSLSPGIVANLAPHHAECLPKRLHIGLFQGDDPL